MSSTLYFFARKNDTFVPIIEYGCKSVYDATDVIWTYAPYEKIKKITPRIIERFIENASDSLKIYENLISRSKEKINLIFSVSNNSLEEKTEAYEIEQNEIEEYEAAEADIKKILSHLELLERAIYEIESNEQYIEDCPNLGIYVGLDCGINVTVDDIITNEYF